MLGASVWYFLRYTTEKHTVEHFMHAVVTGDSQQAYQIWHPHASFSYQDFLSFWGPNGYYSPIKTYRIESAEVPPKGGTGVVIVVEISAYDPFPKAGRDDKVRAKPRSAALGRALRPVDEFSPAVNLHSSLSRSDGFLWHRLQPVGFSPCNALTPTG